MAMASANTSNAETSHMVQVRNDAMVVVRFSKDVENLSIQEIDKAVSDYREDSTKENVQGV